MQIFRAIEDPPEEDYDDDDYPKGSVVPIKPEITDHIGKF